MKISQKPNDGPESHNLTASTNMPDLTRSLTGLYTACPGPMLLVNE